MNIILKKVLLIFLGLFLSLLLLEIFLQSASFINNYIQEYKTFSNYKKLKSKDCVTVLCLGESTTAGQYPVQLQELLNTLNPGKFNVVDCGMPAVKLETLNENFKNNTAKYKPDIILFMMGINNGFYSFSYRNPLLYKNNKIHFKTYKLALLLKQHILSKIKFESQKNRIEKIKNLVDSFIARGFFLQKEDKFCELALILEKILRQEPKNEYVYSSLVLLYTEFLSDAKYLNYGYKMALKGLDLDFIKDKSSIYKAIFIYHFKLSNKNLLKFYTNKAITEAPEIFKTYNAYFMYGFIRDILTPEQKQFILSIMAQIDTKDMSCGFIALEYLKDGDYDNAEKYFKTAEDLRLYFPNLNTYRLYKSIVAKAVHSGVKIICMQYPVRSIEPLKKMLKHEPYFNKITFLSNEVNFKNILRQKHYEDIFSDRFGGDFGHCTDLGNQLIAENAAQTIIKMTKK